MDEFNDDTYWAKKLQRDSLVNQLADAASIKNQLADAASIKNQW